MTSPMNPLTIKMINGFSPVVTVAGPPKSQVQEKETGNKSYTKISMGTALSILALWTLTSKRAQNSIKPYFEKFSSSIKEKMSKNENFQKVERYSSGFYNKIAKAFSLSDVMVNLASCKDILVKKLTPDKFNEVACRFFKKMAIGAVDSKYSKAYGELDKFIALVEKKYPNNTEALQELRELYTEGFSQGARNKRLEAMNTGLKDLDKKIIARFKDIYENYKTKKHEMLKFIAEDISQADKNKIQSEIMGVTSRITNSSSHIAKNIKTNVLKAKSFLGPEDAEGFSIIKKLNAQINNYAKDGSNADEIISTLGELKVSKKVQDKTFAAEIEQAIKIIGENSKKGKIEELLELLKKEQDYETEILPSALKASKAIREAAECEGDKLFDKIRDLEGGCAPADIVSPAIGALALVAYLCKTDTSEEFVSKSLNGGIPLFAGMGASYIATIKLMSGAKALGFGFLFSWLFSLAGERVDKVAQNIIKEEKVKNEFYKAHKNDNVVT